MDLKAIANAGFQVSFTEPPPWKTSLLKNDNSIFAGFYKPHPAQEEDVITEHVVKHGWAPSSVVQMEAFSAHQMIYQKLHDNSLLPGLAGLIKSVQTSREALDTSIQPHNPKLPPRVTWTDQKREAWVLDLVNLEVPLWKLAKNVPHGFKNDKLLDMVVARKVPIGRAVWFIKIVGAGEIANQKSKPGFQPSQYTVEWTNVICEYFKKQLAEVTLPSTIVNRPGMNIKSRSRVMLSDPLHRSKFTAKITYLVHLLQSHADEGLLDRSTYQTWIHSQFRSCHFGHLPFYVYLANAMVDFLSGSCLFQKELTQTSLDRLVQLNAATVPFPALASSIADFIGTILVKMPEAFIAPKLWSSHNELLRSLLVTDRPEDDALRNLALPILKRVDRLLMRKPIDLPADDKARIRLVEALDQSHRNFDMERLHSVYNRNLLPDFTKLCEILTWATTTDRLGAARSQIALSVLRMMSEAKPDLDLQSMIIDWVDSIANEYEEIQISEVVVLLECFQQDGLFSSSHFLQMALSRGLLNVNSLDGKYHRNIHLTLLRALSSHNEAMSLVTQRRILLSLDNDMLRSSKKQLSTCRQKILTCMQDEQDGSNNGSGIHSMLIELSRLTTAADLTSLTERCLGPLLDHILQSSTCDSGSLSTVLIAIARTGNPQTILGYTAKVLTAVSEPALIRNVSDLLISRLPVFIINHRQEVIDILASAYKRLLLAKTPVCSLAYALQLYSTPHQMHAPKSYHSKALNIAKDSPPEAITSLSSTPSEEELHKFSLSLHLKMRSSEEDACTVLTGFLDSSLDQESNLETVSAVVSVLNDLSEGGIETYIVAWIDARKQQSMSRLWPFFLSLLMVDALSLINWIEHCILKMIRESVLSQNHLEDIALVFLFSPVRQSTSYHHSTQFLHFQALFSVAFLSTAGLSSIVNLVKALSNCELKTETCQSSIFNNEMVKMALQEQELYDRTALAPSLDVMHSDDIQWPECTSPLVIYRIHGISRALCRAMANLFDIESSDYIDRCLFHINLSIAVQILDNISHKEDVILTLLYRSLEVICKDATETSLDTSDLGNRFKRICQLIAHLDGFRKFPVELKLPAIVGTLPRFLQMCKEKGREIGPDLHRAALALSSILLLVEGLPDKWQPIAEQLVLLQDATFGEIQDQIQSDTLKHWLSVMSDEERLILAKFVKDSLPERRDLFEPYLFRSVDVVSSLRTLIPDASNPKLLLEAPKSPWINIDAFANPTLGNTTSSLNNGALDVSKYGIKGIEVPANDLPTSVPPIAGRKLGAKINFDSEVWTARESIWARDARRGLSVNGLLNQKALDAIQKRPALPIRKPSSKGEVPGKRKLQQDVADSGNPLNKKQKR